MKSKEKGIVISVFILIFLILLITPLPSGALKDGGTRAYTSLTYKIVNWNRISENGIYDKTKIYLFPENFKSLDSLWYKEEENVEYTFIATVLEINSDSVTVQPAEDSTLFGKDARVTFSTLNLEKIDISNGSTVQISFNGGVRESYPAHINAISWKLADDLRHLAYTEQWIDKDIIEKSEKDFFSDIVITKIYSDCFFAKTVIPTPYEIKLNTSLSDEWCVGDQIICTYENLYCDWDNYRIEADMLTIKESDWQPDPNAAYKPVIYLYPEKVTAVSVKLHIDGELTCTYPSYSDGWSVTAEPEGTLTDEKGQTYNYLYWEGLLNTQYDFSKGFCVKGEDTAEFLEEALEKLGLNRKEANEFIVYWLPLMENNPYNIISFQSEAYTDAAILDISPVPDTAIRVFMAWQKAESYVNLPLQDLKTPERTGFTVVEWGGAEIE